MNLSSDPRGDKVVDTALFRNKRVPNLNHHQGLANLSCVCQFSQSLHYNRILMSRIMMYDFYCINVFKLHVKYK